MTLRVSSFRIASIVMLVGALLALASTPVALAQSTGKVVETLAPAARATLDAVLAESNPPQQRWNDVARDTLSVHGDVGLLVKALEAIADPDTTPAETRREARRGLALVLQQDGKITRALEHADKAIALRASDDVLLLRAHLLDALDRVDDAIKAYAALRDSSADVATKDSLGLRIALLEATKPAPLKPTPATPTPTPTPAPAAGEGAAPAAPVAEEPPSALLQFASRPEATAEFKNRAAIVLALIARPREAIQLFVPGGEGAEAFRQEIRLAEWALAAKAAPEAREHAWKARSIATLRRDRLYALTVLVEAHRADNSQAALIEQFATTPDLDAESRRTWIDLLRETARVDEALALFRAASAGNFTADMRRELLEMCREAGREEELVSTYAEMIATEPERIDWREGLSRYWLERGRREDAEGVWTTYLAAYGDAAHRLAAAKAARDLGLDALAERVANECLAFQDGALDARMFLFDFETSRGRVEAAIAQLEAFDREADPKSPLRIQLAEAFERVGDKKRAADVLMRIRDQRGKDDAEEDLEMRLAWLLSEVGDETGALERWRNLWRRTTSLPRRRQVEDRLMAVASRLGVLADLAVELEEKLADGKADDRDASLLVRLYQKVGDPASAAEVIGEHMKQTGADPIATLGETARVYLGGKDYFHFEKTVRKLVALDPENRSDHLRQLAMSQLERGKPQEARAVLASLAAEESRNDAAEFEAGVLSLANLHDDAARTYRRGLAAHPERIDSYLLLGNSLRAMGQTDRAIGMFQYLAEHADKDDLFTVAIDGILNMSAKEPVLRWARRIALERLATGHDRMYLYQLVADLAEELNDVPGRMRAMEGSLAIAGEQRSSVLRELMDVAQGQGTSSFTIVNGMMVERRTGGDDPRRLAYGRRLIGLGDIVPPQVYLELGEAFLRSGAVANASKTFSMARDVPDWSVFQRQVAESFEVAGFARNALTVYERAMASQGIDVGLMLKTGELHEQLGHDARAVEQYRRGIELLLARHPPLAAVLAKKEGEDEDPYGWNARNVGDFETLFPGLVAGFVAAATDADAAALLASQRALLDADLQMAAATTVADANARVLEGFPRVRERSAFVRDLALRFDQTGDLASMDLALLAAFPADAKLLEAACASRARYGHFGLARALVDASGRPDAERAKALASIGIGGSAEGVGLNDVVLRLLPLLVDGDRDRASRMLRGVRLFDVTKDDVPQLRLLLHAALYLDDDQAVVTLASQVVRMLVANGKGYEDQRQIEPLLTRARGALDAESYGLVIDAYVDAVVAKKEAFAANAYYLTRIQRDLGRPLIAADVLKSKIDECLPDQAYLVSSLLQLAPAADRIALLEGVWPKVPATERADVAISVLSASKVALEPSVAEFVVGAFEDGLEKIDDPQMLTYQVRSAYDSNAQNRATVERIATAAHAKFPANLAFATVVAAARAALQPGDKALAAMKDALALAPQEERSYEVREAGELLADAFIPAHKAELLAEIDALETSGAKPEAVTALRLAVADKLADPAMRSQILEDAVAKNPDSIETVRDAYWGASSSMSTARRIELLERLVALDGKNEQWRPQLVQVWRAERNPVRALAASRAGLSESTADAAPTVEAEKLEPATYELVKKAVDAADPATASTTYRRVWRRFIAGSSRRSFGSAVFYSFSMGRSQDPAWPEDKKPDADARRSRGGLEALLGNEDEDNEEKREREAAARKSVYDGVAEQGFGREELARQLRSLGPSALATAHGLVRGLQRALVKDSSDAVATWLERTRTGRASHLDRALLLSWTEDHLETLGEGERPPLAELAAAVRAEDTSQLRALARLHAKLGDRARASRIWQWCATLATANRWVSSDSSDVSARDLLEEVQKYLTGDELLAAVDAVLMRADPGGDLYDRDDYVALVIATWTKAVGAKAAAAHCAASLEATTDLARGILRSAASAAVPVFIANGDEAKALRAIEVALCSFDSSEVQFDEEDAYAMSWKLRAQSLDPARAREWFPAKTDAENAAWCSAAAAKVLAWETAGRLEKSAARMLLSLLAVRVHACGDVALAEQLLDRVRANAASSSGLVVIDLERLLGHEDRARALEDELLAKRTLLAERIPEVIERVRTTVGANVAFERGAAAAEFTPHPQLVESLIAMATELGLTEEAARFTRLREESAKAATELESTW